MSKPGLVQIQHFRRPHERAFVATERDHVTILFGGLIIRTDWYIRLR